MLQERIKQALAHRKSIAAPGERVTQKTLAQACGISAPSVSDWFTGKTRSMDGHHLLLASKYLRVNPVWLSTGRGPMKAEETNNVETGPDILGRVPLISWVQAGDFAEAADPYLPGEAEQWLDCPVAHSPSTFALRVRGDSMTAPTGNGRTYPEGCIIFVDPEMRTPVNGQRIIAALDSGDGHEVTFKIYKDEDGRKWLQPLNPQHEPIRAPFRVLGTVIGKWEDE